MFPCPATLGEALENQALSIPDRIALTLIPEDNGEARDISFRDLYASVQRAAETLIDAGARGERVLLLLPQSLEYIVWFFASCYAGATAVPLYPLRRSTAGRIEAVGAACTARFAIAASSPAQGLVEQAGLSKLHWVVLNREIQQLVEGGERRAYRARPHELAYLQFTSGSTSQPRGVMIAHENALANMNDIAEAAQYTRESVSVSWLPLFHDMGLVCGMLTPLLVGCRAVLMTPAMFARDPSSWFSAIHRYRGTHSGGPNFAYDLCVKKIAIEQRSNFRLDSWAVAYNGAEPVSYETIRRFSVAFESCGFKASAFFPSYGLAEATLGVTATHFSENGHWTVDGEVLSLGRVELANEHTRITTELVGVGSPYGNTIVRILDQKAGATLPEAEIGEVWVKGRSVAIGYWNLPNESEDAFQNHLAQEDGIFLRTGDLGAIFRGHLIIAGRSKDLIIIRGRNHYPQDIELTAEASHPALSSHSSVAFSVQENGEETLVVAAEIARRMKSFANEVLSCIRDAVLSKHEVLPFCILLVREGSIPKTTSGKLQRSRCKTLFQSSSLDTIAESRGSTDLTSIVLEKEPIRELSAAGVLVSHLVASHGNCDPSQLDPSRPLRLSGMDSLGSLSLQHAIEQTFGLRISLEDLADKSIQEIASACDEAPSVGDRRLTEMPERQHRGDIFPLSFGQQALWFLNRRAPSDPSYNIAIAAKISGLLDSSRLAKAIETLLDSHPFLRAKFRYLSNGAVVQDVTAIPPPLLVTKDASSEIYAEANRPFDLESDHVFRSRLYRESETEHTLLLVVHHIATDLWSLELLFEELGELYRSPTASSLPEFVDDCYGDFVEWQRRLVESPEGKASRDYWLNELADVQPAIKFPAPHEIAEAAEYVSTEVDLLQEQLAGQLRKFAAENGVTLYVALLAVLRIVLSRYAYGGDVVIASPVSGRSEARFAGTVGYMVNTLLLAGRVNNKTTFLEVLQQTKEKVSLALRHQDYPYPLIRHFLRDLSAPVGREDLTVIFAFQQARRNRTRDLAPFLLSENGGNLSWGDLVLESVALPRKSVVAGLTITAAESPDGLIVKWEARQTVMSTRSLERVAGQFRRALTLCLENPGAMLGDQDRIALVDYNSLRQQEDYWRRVLSGAPALLDLPSEKLRVAAQNYDGGTVDLLVDPELATSLRTLAERHGATLFTILLAGWASLLARLSGQDDLIVGIPKTNREFVEAENVTGFLVNMLPIRASPRNSLSANAVIEQVRDSVQGAQESQDIPFLQLVEMVSPVRSLWRHPLFQTTFAWENAPSGKPDLSGLAAEPITAETIPVRMDIALVLREMGEGIHGCIEYSSALFERSTVERYAGYFVRVLEAVARDATTAVGELSLLSATERHQLVHEWSGDEPDSVDCGLVHELIEQSAVACPDIIAVAFEQVAISYRELNSSANRVAHYLIELGAGPDRSIAICLRPGWEMIVAILAVLKSGSAYVLLDSTHATEQLRRITDDCDPIAVLTQAEMGPIFERQERTFLVLDSQDFQTPWAGKPDHSPQLRIGIEPEHLACVIYSTQSMDEPKAVMVTHRNLWVSTSARKNAYVRYSRCLLLSPLVLHSLIIFGALSTGGTLFLTQPETVLQPSLLSDLIQSKSIETMLCTPAIYTQLLTHAGWNADALKTVILTGEQPTSSLVAESAERVQVVLFHEYGPAEATMCASIQRCQPCCSLSLVPISRPVPKSRLYILDSQLQPAPKGVGGEILIGGLVVTRGYMKRSDLTADCFIPDALSNRPGSRLYRTGERGRWREDGTIEFLGSAENQVMFCGFQIDLEKLAARIREVPGVREAIALVHEDPRNEKRLVAYYTTATGQHRVSGDQVRMYLTAVLPDYMVPSAFAFVETMPRTLNGEVDRELLAATTASRRKAGRALTSLESGLAAIWEEILGIVGIGPEDNFFELGGHSLLATILIFRIREKFLVELPVTSLFEHATLSEFAHAIANAGYDPTEQVRTEKTNDHEGALHEH